MTAGISKSVSVQEQMDRAAEILGAGPAIVLEISSLGGVKLSSFPWAECAGTGFPCGRVNQGTSLGPAGDEGPPEASVEEETATPRTKYSVTRPCRREGRAHPRSGARGA